jgi:hypothetical protein
MFWKESSAHDSPSAANPRLKLPVVLLLVIALLVGWSHSSAPQPAPGILVYGEPLQTETTLGPWQRDDYTFTPLASYEITARILGKKLYSSDRSAELSPVDLALGWEEMSDSSVLQTLTIKQSERWYYVSWRNSLLDTNAIILHSANTHILPANREVAERIEKLQKHEVVRLRGSLVQVTSKDGFLWRSSLTRSDTGDGSCEVFWVESVDVEPIQSLQASANSGHTNPNHQ